MWNTYHKIDNGGNSISVAMDFFIMVIYFAFWMVGNILKITKEEKENCLITGRRFGDVSYCLFVHCLQSHWVIWSYLLISMIYITHQRYSIVLLAPPGTFETILIYYYCMKPDKLIPKNSIKWMQLPLLNMETRSWAIGQKGNSCIISKQSPIKGLVVFFHQELQSWPFDSALKTAEVKRRQFCQIYNPVSRIWLLRISSSCKY